MPLQANRSCIELPVQPASLGIGSNRPGLEDHSHGTGYGETAVGRHGAMSLSDACIAGYGA
jgi:hypothetical protein